VAGDTLQLAVGQVDAAPHDLADDYDDFDEEDRHKPGHAPYEV
jgi:hypothetical protein